VEVAEEHPAGLGPLRLEPGLWTVAFEPPSPSLLLGIRASAPGGRFLRIPANGFAVEPGQGPWDLILSAAPGARAHVRAVTLRKVRP
jgi:hypothetical protein